MADPVYDHVDSKIPSDVNPCYEFASFKPRDVTATSVQMSSEAKKPSACGCFHCCVVIGLFLVGAVACVSFALVG